MAQFEIETSDGRIFSIEADDEDGARQVFQQQLDLEAQQRPQQQAPVQPPQTEPDSLVDRALDVGGAALDFVGVAASGLVGDVLGGVEGLAALAAGKGSDEAARVVRDRQDAVRTGSGRLGRVDSELLEKGFEKAAPVLQEIEEGIDFVAMGPDAEGNPFAGAMIKTAILGLPELLGLKTGALRQGTRSAARGKVQKLANDRGINMRPEQVTDDFVKSVERTTTATKGEGFVEVAQAVSNRRAQAKEAVRGRFDDARQNGVAFLNATNAEDFGRSMRQKLVDDGFDLEVPEMRNVARTIDEIDGIRFNKPGQGRRPTDLQQGAVQLDGTPIDFDLNDWEMIRRRVNKRFGSDRQANAALNSVKKGMDEFLDNQFNIDAIRGDAASVQRWKGARAAHKQYRDTFDADRTIKNLSKVDSTPEQYARWILGARAMNAAPQAGATVKRLKELLGPDSREFAAIKQEVLHDLAEPILRENPSFKQFVKNVDDFTRKNPSLVRELDLDLEDLSFLRNTAKALDTVKPSTAILGSVPRAAMRFLFGHGIAKAGVKVMFLGNVADRIFGANMATRRSIMSEIAGTPLDAPVIPIGGPLAGAVIASQFENETRKDK